MMNEVWFEEVLCPNRLETLVRGKPSISLMLGRKKKVEAETTPSLLSIFESTTT